MPPMIFQVRFKHGVYEVPENDLDEAVSLGGEVLNDNLIKNSVDTNAMDSTNSEANLVASNKNNNNMASPIDGISMPPASIERPAEMQTNSQISAPNKALNTNMYKVKFPDGGVYEVPESDLEEAKGYGGQIVAENELGYGDRALQYGQGIASIPALGADLANKYIASPTLRAAGSVAHIASKGVGIVSQNAEDVLQQGSDAAYKAADYYSKTDVTGQTEEGFHKLAGKDITPKDKIGKLLHNAGQFSFPFSNILKAAKTVGQATQAAAKHVGVSFGGAAAPIAMGDAKLTQEGSSGRLVEDFLLTVAGMAGADKGFSKAKMAIAENSDKLLGKILNRESLGEIPKEAKNTLREMLAGKTLSIGAKPNMAINEFAKQEGIQLPFEIALGGRIHKFLSNSALKSLFVSKSYNNVIEHADRDMINAVRNKINTISPSEIEGATASDKALNYLKGESASIDNEVRRLYQEKAYPLLKTSDAHIPKHTIDTVNDMIKTTIALKAAAPGPKSKALADYLKTIGEEWGFIPKGKDLEKFGDSPEFLKIVIDEFVKNPKKVPVENMIGQLQATYEKTKHQRDIPGLENLYNRIVGSLKRDIENTSNKEFLREYRTANKYFEENEITRIRSDMANSLMTGDVPKEAFRYMGDAKEIRQLRKVLGDAPAAKEILNSLKRAKLDQILMSKIIDSSGTISYSAMSNMFNRKPESQALLKELLGDQYSGMKRLADISQEFVKSGKEFGNASRTTLIARDLKGVTDMVKIIGSTVATIGTSAAFHGISPTATLEPIGIWAFSRMAANKNFVNTALKYAEASQINKEVYGNRLKRMVTKYFEVHAEEIKNFPQSFIALNGDGLKNIAKNDEQKNEQ